MVFPNHCCGLLGLANLLVRLCWAPSLATAPGRQERVASTTPVVNTCLTTKEVSAYATRPVRVKTAPGRQPLRDMKSESPKGGNGLHRVGAPREREEEMESEGRGVNHITCDPRPLLGQTGSYWKVKSRKTTQLDNTIRPTF